MSLGRIKRERAKIARALNVKTKTIGVTIKVYRYVGHRGAVGYRAMACFGRKGSAGLRNCTFSRGGRTPQAAISKALKVLSRKAALRGRRNRA